jgi:hypothetical protein
MTSSTVSPKAIKIFQSVFRRVRPRTPVPEIEVHFRPYADINNVIRIRDGKLIARLSDILGGAPLAVVEALAFILLCKLYRKPVPPRHEARYNQFLNRGYVRKQLSIIRRVRGRKWIGDPAGAHYNLEAIFDSLNARYFHSQLDRPRLGWSRSCSRTLLGHYDSVHNSILISKIFDCPGHPRCLVEYILFHEMLHLKYPVEYCNNRRKVHPPAFRKEERRFPGYEQANRLIRSL